MYCSYVYAIQESDTEYCFKLVFYTEAGDSRIDSTEDFLIQLTDDAATDILPNSPIAQARFLPGQYRPYFDIVIPHPNPGHPLISDGENILIMGTKRDKLVS